MCKLMCVFCDVDRLTKRSNFFVEKFFVCFPRLADPLFKHWRMESESSKDSTSRVLAGSEGFCVNS